jgi:phthalate 4,5-dioxygenase
MLSREKNDLITQTGQDTPCGDLLRRYWQPAALVEEFADDRPLVPVRLFGEDLVAFRDDQGRYGLFDRRCTHRGADMCFGRLEDGGLRCPFHGWLFDVDGNCLEQPAEPADNNFFKKVRQTAYPCIERNGIVFTYMGPLNEQGEPPELPDYDCFQAPDAYTFAFKGHVDCNWLQALEVGIDPAHASYLHRFFEDEDPDEAYGKQFRDRADGTDLTVTQVLREYDRPEIEVEEAAHGLRLKTLRDLDDSQRHVRVTNLVFPNAFCIPISNDMIITQWHVPVDDGENYWYAMFIDFRNTVDKKTMRDQRLDSCTLPDYKSTRNRDNNYGFDAEEQRTKTYTGMGMDINVHDQWAVESLGRIQDRTIEHLGTSDKAIIANRKMLFRAIEAVQNGDELPAGAGPDLTGPVAVDAVGPRAEQETIWLDRDQARRAQSPWVQA